MSIIIPSNSIVSGGFSVDNSCRFDGSSSVMSVDTSSASTNKVTISAWIKRSKITADGFIVTSYRDNSNRAKFGFGGADNLTYFMTEGGTDTEWNTTAKFRDTGAWMHVVAQLDNTQSTFANRCKLFVNGTEYATSSSGSSTQNSATAIIGNGTTSVGNSYYGGAYQGNWFGGYMAQVAMIQGVIHAPTDFGEFDEDSGIWKPIDITALTYASYSFLLDFEDSSNLGNNASGSGLADLTEAGLAAIDQSTDSCTNNLCTLNPLNQTNSGAVFSDGNLKMTISGQWLGLNSTFFMTTGKWYFEVKYGSGNYDIGIAQDETAATQTSEISTSNHGFIGRKVGGYVLTQNGGQPYKQNNATNEGDYGSQASGGDIMMVAYDADTGKLFTGKGGTWNNSSDPANGTSPMYTVTATASYTPAISVESGVLDINFGNPSFSISSGNADGNGYGNFEYAVPSGYYSLNTKNLAEYG